MTVPDHLWRFSTRTAIDSLAQRFGLPNDPQMQDWQWEVADPARLDEFLTAYETAALPDDERFVLMEMILQSFDDTDQVPHGSVSWSRIEQALDRNIAIHIHTVWYWSCVGDDLADAFRIAAFVRNVLERHRRRFEHPPN
jgi:hypothetical protein